MIHGLDEGLAAMRRECAGDTKAPEKCRRTVFRSVSIAWVLCLSASLSSCSGGFETEPLVEYSTEVVVAGERSPSITRQLDAGVYLLEIRERDVDLRISIDSGILHS